MRRIKVLNAFWGALLVMAMVMGGGCIFFAPQYITYTVWDLPPCDLKNATYEDKDILLTIEPIPDDFRTNRENYDYSIRLFNLTITNKTNQNIILDWNKVYFLNKDGQPDGEFMLLMGKTPIRGSLTQPLLILANSSKTIKIYPANLVYDSVRWGLGDMDDGTFGAYIIIAMKGHEKNIKITVDIGKAPSREYRRPK